MTTATLIQPGTYTIDPARTAVRFTVTHAFGWKPVHGTFTVRDGVIEVGARCTVSVELDAGSFRTDEPKRDADITGKRFLDSAHHPTMMFRGSAAPDATTLDGTLTVRGTAAPVTLTLVEAREDGTGWCFTAAARIDRYAAGVTAGRGIIARYLDVEFEVYAAR
jgi:polyisoprenoid-binding protein YceI